MECWSDGVLANWTPSLHHSNTPHSLEAVSIRQHHRNLKCFPVSNYVIDNSVAGFEVEPNPDVEFEHVHLQPPAIDSGDNVFGADSGVPGGFRDEVSHAEGELGLRNSERPFLFRLQI